MLKLYESLFWFYLFIYFSFSLMQDEKQGLQDFIASTEERFNWLNAWLYLYHQFLLLGIDSPPHTYKEIGFESH